MSKVKDGVIIPDDMNHRTVRSEQKPTILEAKAIIEAAEIDKQFNLPGLPFEHVTISKHTWGGVLEYSWIIKLSHRTGYLHPMKDKGTTKTFKTIAGVKRNLNAYLKNHWLLRKNYKEPENIDHLM